MIEANRYKLGLFVIAGSLLFMGVVFLLGIREIFEPKVRFGTLFNESVRGLEVGTAVKFRGVSVGKVSNITLRPDDNFVWVEMEAMLSSVDPGKESKGLSGIDRARLFQEILSKEVEKGLRCRLEISSIATGMKFVELDYFDPGKNPPLTADIPDGIIYIPATESLLSGLSTSLSDALAKIASIDYSKISSEVVETFRSVNQLLSNPKIESLINRMEKISQEAENISSNLNNTLTEEKMRKITSEFESTLVSIQELSVALRDEVKAASLPKLSENATETLQEANKVSAAIVDMRKNLNATLDKLDDVIDSLSELVRYIEEDPSSLVRGRQKPRAEDFFKDR